MDPKNTKKTLKLKELSLEDLGTVAGGGAEGPSQPIQVASNSGNSGNSNSGNSGNSNSGNSNSGNSNSA
jgi:hypothetical protein